MNGTNQILDKSGKALDLAMQTLHLEGEIYPFGGVVRVIHHFECKGDRSNPLEVLYVAMLPRDATLRRFQILGQGFEKNSKLERREKAQRQYDKGIDKGHVSALAEIGDDGMVTLSVGQIRPGETIRVSLEIVCGCEKVNGGIRFRFPFTLAPTYHSQMTCQPPADGRFVRPFGDVLLPLWTNSPSKLHSVAFNLIVHNGVGIKSVASPSHRISVENRTVEDGGGAEVELAGFGDVPNRDLVLDVAYTKAGESVMYVESDVEGCKNPRWTMVLPSTVFGEPEKKPRRVCLVLDRSGSMGSNPMRQAKAGVLAVLSTLRKEDRFGLVAFDDRVEVLSDVLTKATRDGRQSAVNFLSGVEARGGTEIGLALTRALQLLKNKGEIFLLTDGDVSGISRIIPVVQDQGVRLHILGINSASQDRALHELATSTGGISRVVGVRENVGQRALGLFNAVCAPVLEGVVATLLGSGPPVDVEVGDVWENVPVVLRSLDPVPGVVKFRSRDGVPVPTLFPKHLERTVQVSRRVLGPLYAAEQIQILERRVAASGKRKDRKKLRDLSRTFGLASSEMSLVAVVDRKGDKRFEGWEVKQEIVKLGYPEDFAAPSSITITTSTMDWMGEATPRSMTVNMAPRTGNDPVALYNVSNCVSGASPGWNGAWTATRDSSELDGVSIKALTPVEAAMVRPSMADQVLSQWKNQNTDHLLARLASLDDDGGVIADGIESRVLETIQLILAAWMADQDAGVYGLHLERMASFLVEVAAQLPARRAFILSVAVQTLDGTLEVQVPPEGGFSPSHSTTLVEDFTPVWEALARLVVVA